MKVNKYKSHERKDGQVWLNIWNRDQSKAVGKIEVRSVMYHYRLFRVGRLGGGTTPLTPMITLGDAGVTFEKRKDAENYALLLAMRFSGDFEKQDLLRPQIFGGEKNGGFRYSAARTELFWNGADDVNPAEGWDKIDPEGFLEQLPDPLDAIPSDDDCISARGDNIWVGSDAVTTYFQEWYLTPKVDKAFDAISLDITDDPEDLLQIEPRDQSYMMLSALQNLRNTIPANWLFPSRLDEVTNLIPKLWSSLTDDVLETAERLEKERQKSDRFLEKVQKIKDLVTSRLPEDVDKDHFSVLTRLNSCAQYLVEFRDGNADGPEHSEPEYRALMKLFSNKMDKDEDEAVAWLADTLTKAFRQKR